jgi:SAM-dependent methyltransferase
LSITKAWDWTKNTDDKWLNPCVESAFLAERWQSKGFKRFLDLGCGLGRHSVYMAQKGFDVTAVDLSDLGVSHLNEWAVKENLAVKTTVCDMLTLPFADNSFDCIMAYNVIYHTDTPGFIKAMEEITRVLKPGGEVFITLISKSTPAFQNSADCRRIDENTVLLDEDETERDVPHFYVDIEDIKKLFSGWTFIAHPKEWCDYKIDGPNVYRRHWSMLVMK